MISITLFVFVIFIEFIFSYFNKNKNQYFVIPCSGVRNNPEISKVCGVNIITLPNQKHVQKILSFKALNGSITIWTINHFTGCMELIFQLQLCVGLK